MKPRYRKILIALLIVAAFCAGYESGYTLGSYTITIRERNEKHELIKRIRELEEREKSRSTSGTNSEKPPKSE